MKFAIKKSYFLYAAIIVLVITAIVLGIIFSGKKDNIKEHRAAGAVVSHGLKCSGIGAQFLSDGGTAVDAAVATLICEGAMVPQSMGIGGGFVGILYNKNTKTMETLIARETAPAAAHQNMFINTTVITGALSVGVPGELLGYWEMHQKYGKLPWKTLFEPTIKLCREGIVVSSHLVTALKSKEENIRKHPDLLKVFSKADGTFYNAGEKLKRLDLAMTLEKIANKGPDIFYNGEIGKTFLEDLTEQGGILTLDDLKNYTTSWEDNNHITANITGGYTLYTTPLPTSGALLAFIMKVVKNLYTEEVGLFWHRVVETFKHAYGQRTHLGDIMFEKTMANDIKATLGRLVSDDFANEIRSKIQDRRTFTNFDYYGADFSNQDDHGTSNIAVLGTDGSAVVITSTVNQYFGGQIISKRTGIIPNNEMDDFSTPGVVNSYGLRASPANYIQPHKRPLSSMCPSIILDDNGDVRLLIGAAGGSKITTTVATVIIHYLLSNKSMEESVEARRVHHQLAPMVVNMESNVPSVITSYLEEVGHVLELEQSPTGFAAVTAIGARQSSPVPVFDKRRLGSTATVKAVI